MLLKKKNLSIYQNNIKNSGIQNLSELQGYNNIKFYSRYFFSLKEKQGLSEILTFASLEILTTRPRRAKK